jgi:mycothiol synthase
MPEPTIRPLQPDDLFALWSLRQELANRALLSSAGHGWVVEVDGDVTGYAAFNPIPGLPGVADLAGFIAPAFQRQGLGSALLAHVGRESAKMELRRLSVSFSSLEHSAAQFLMRRGFFEQHIELDMELAAPGALPSPSFPPGIRIEELNAYRSSRIFAGLLEESFGEHPWYQPYEQEEIDQFLEHGPILFLVDGEQPVGFAWIKLYQPRQAFVEPIGLTPAYQKRGLGKQLLLAAIEGLVARGAERVQLGVWLENERAVRLYRNLGFEETARQYYLAWEWPFIPAEDGPQK